ncbi:MAG TPA: DUF5985 family protein [Steroidobacteraceae bacterium]|jgi:uncharacterized membrane protein HdeD (DUF308 family)|nr:DUF5985 family protein [Steroidobacteraceae bacterium]
MLEGFLLGVIVTASLAASAFFLKFWRQTHDLLFLGFSAAFAIEGVNRIAFLFVEHPDEGNPVIYMVRLFSYLLILAAIVNKNRA